MLVIPKRSARSRSLVNVHPPQPGILYRKAARRWASSNGMGRTSRHRSPGARYRRYRCRRSPWRPARRQKHRILPYSAAPKGFPAWIILILGRREAFVAAGRRIPFRCVELSKGQTRGRCRIVANYVRPHKGSFSESIETVQKRRAPVISPRPTSQRRGPASSSPCSLAMNFWCRGPC